MLTINTNVMALNAQLALKQNTQEINRLTKVLIDANGDGSTNVGLDGPTASVVPNYLTSFIRGTSQAMTNTDQAKELLSKEQATLSKITDALIEMKKQADNINNSASSKTDPSIINAMGLFDGARDSLLTAIDANVHNGISLSNGEKSKFEFQVGPNPKDKISTSLINLKTSSPTAIALDTLQDIDISDATQPVVNELNETFLKVDPSLFTSIQAGLDLINQANGSVTANISRLGFVKSRLEADSDRSIDYRSNLLSDVVAVTNAKLAVQRMLQSVAESVLAQANVSNQGVLDLITSAKIH